MDENNKLAKDFDKTSIESRFFTYQYAEKSIHSEDELDEYKMKSSNMEKVGQIGNRKKNLT